MEQKSLRDLKKIAKKAGLTPEGMSRATLEYEISKLGQTKTKTKTKSVYQPISQLGIKGRDGKVLLVKTKSGKTYAKKQFRNNRPIKAITLEAKLFHGFCKRKI